MIDRCVKINLYIIFVLVIKTDLVNLNVKYFLPKINGNLELLIVFFK